MTTFTETFHDGGFLVSRDLGTYTTDQIVLKSGTAYSAGLVLGKITAVGADQGKYKAWNPGNSDGSQIVAGVLFGSKDATSADKPGVVVSRAVQVNASELLWFSGASAGNITTGLAGLVAIGVIPR